LPDYHQQWYRVQGQQNSSAFMMMAAEMLITIRRAAKPINAHPGKVATGDPAADHSPLKERRQSPGAQHIGWQREHPADHSQTQSARRRSSQGEAFHHHLFAALGHLRLCTRLGLLAGPVVNVFSDPRSVSALGELGVRSGKAPVSWQVSSINSDRATLPGNGLLFHGGTSTPVSEREAGLQRGLSKNRVGVMGTPQG